MNGLSQQLMHALIPFLDLIILALNIFSILVLIWGVLLAGKDFLTSERKRISRISIAHTNTIIKNFLGSYILLSLEILIAADIIESIINPDMADVLRLAALVVIRTIISYFLHREVEDAEKAQSRRQEREKQQRKPRE